MLAGWQDGGVGTDSGLGVLDIVEALNRNPCVLGCATEICASCGWGTTHVFPQNSVFEILVRM